MDAGFLNGVCNDPAVRPDLGGEGEIDLTGIVSNPENYALVSEFGGFILTRHEAGVYEVHSQFLPVGRGSHAIEAMRDGMRYMFASTDCTMIQTKVPAANTRAGGFAKLAGFQHLFDMNDTAHMVVTIDRWLSFDAGLDEHGHWFHKRLEAAKIAKGSALPIHADDQSHDRAVGAAVLLCRRGNPAKAVWAYNRWARLAGYAPVYLVSERPAVIDLLDAVVEVRGEDMEVLTCR